MSPPLVALRGARVGFGGRPLFDGLALGLSRGDRACLVGRNGSGKSTLLKALAGDLDLDGGERFVEPGARIAYLPQDPAFAAADTVAAYVAEGLAAGPAGSEHRHRIEAVLTRLDLGGERRLGELSGGEGRRVALARALIAEPDVLLLDEPTNHLDLPTIEWLEGVLERFAGALLVVSHDRALLERLGRRVLWLDRGTLRRLNQGFAAFDDWSAKLLADEAEAAHRLDRRIAAETHWLRQGLTARRRRNQGRLRRLGQMRDERAARLDAAGRARIEAGAVTQTARLVVEATEVGKAFPGEDGAKVIVAGLSLRILRGDRIGVIGANGAGKTTLLRLLAGDLAPDAGEIRLGPGVRPVYFDQRRASLDPEATPWQTLAGQGDHLMVRGRSRHVVGYLRDFLFDERQARSPVKSLSGGERSRLLLARLLALPGNLLILDEPTNDLDMETLDLLQEVLGDYDGTLLLVSHDRDFLDRVVNGIVAMEGDGRVREYAGGYRDYLAQRGSRPPLAAPPRAKARRPSASGREETGREETGRTRLSYRDERELARLPAAIEALGGEIRELERRLADPGLYERDRAAFEAAARRLDEAGAELAAAEARWLILETRREDCERARRAPGRN